jgi:hypothetical protein
MLILSFGIGKGQTNQRAGRLSGLKLDAGPAMAVQQKRCQMFLDAVKRPAISSEERQTTPYLRHLLLRHAAAVILYA